LHIWRSRDKTAREKGIGGAKNLGEVGEATASGLSHIFFYPGDAVFGKNTGNTMQGAKKA